MSSPEDKEKHRRRMKNKWAKEVRTKKYQPRVVEDKKRKVDLEKMSHAELVRMIQEEERFRELEEDSKIGNRKEDE